MDPNTPQMPDKKDKKEREEGPPSPLYLPSPITGTPVPDYFTGDELVDRYLTYQADEAATDEKSEDDEES